MTLLISIFLALAMGNFYNRLNTVSRAVLNQTASNLSRNYNKKAHRYLLATMSCISTMDFIAVWINIGIWGALGVGVLSMWIWYYIYGGIVNKVMGQPFFKLDGNDMGKWFARHKWVYWALSVLMPVAFIVLLIIEL